MLHFQHLPVYSSCITLRFRLYIDYSTNMFGFFQMTDLLVCFNRQVMIVANLNCDGQVIKVFNNSPILYTSKNISLMFCTDRIEVI